MLSKFKVFTWVVFVTCCPTSGYLLPLTLSIARRPKSRLSRRLPHSRWLPRCNVPLNPTAITTRKSVGRCKGPIRHTTPCTDRYQNSPTSNFSSHGALIKACIAKVCISQQLETRHFRNRAPVNWITLISLPQSQQKMAVLVILAGILIAIITRDIVNLTIYYKKARTIGFPVIVTPVEPFQPLWALVLPLLAPILRRLPYGLGEFVDYGSFNWYFQTKNRIHRDLGPAIIVVNPGGLKIMLADGLASEGKYDFVTRTPSRLVPNNWNWNDCSGRFSKNKKSTFPLL